MEAIQVQSVPSVRIAACMIVPEVLKENNYERWCIFMKHYFGARDLLDVVLSGEMPLDEDPRDWIKKNDLALHAMKISCGVEKFDKIKEMNSAQDAWNALADLHKQKNEDGGKGSETGIAILEREQAKTLLKDIRRGDSDAVKKVFETHPYSASALENGSTALHVAITTKMLGLAKELISEMSEDELETQDKSGRTVLSLAACNRFHPEILNCIVKCLVEKNKKLLEIPDSNQRIPLVLACASHHRWMTAYLYSVTPMEFLDPVYGDHGFYLLRECIRNHMFGVNVPIIENPLEADKWKTFSTKPKANPDIVWSLDPEHSRDMLMYAVAYRQKEIAAFLYHELDVWRDSAAFTIDEDHNNILHLAAKLVPSCPGILIPDPVLRLQKEAMWFKEVEGLVPQLVKDERNKDDETPLEVFRREHQGLLKEAQTWVKDTVNFAAIIGTLIVGVMFAANITVPGGNNDRDGLPIFYKRSAFQLFFGTDGASLIFASLSVLILLDIHKSSLTVEDFLNGNLNTKLATGFYLLFWSIGTMLICSFASIRLVDRQSPLAMQIIFAAIIILPFISLFRSNLKPFFKIFYFFYIRGLTASRRLREIRGLITPRAVVFKYLL
ncbi:hypothetical protein SLEP1_g47498 [Rubroshorea leprosula]|uniref:PGG domain-containing protein n=1 Tax=Rubroshorea leprosula TaxID=152421 RepID=A0AAV5LRK4_9ROSI|nr:hypothetical protein SLEP1_g47498 [Rubroshorea leprosula]